MFLLILQRLGVGLREALHLEHLGDISPIDKDIGYEAIVDILAVCTPGKESSAKPCLVTQHLYLFVNPAVPDLLGTQLDDEARST